MDYSKMSVDDIINYLLTEYDNGRIIPIEELDKAVDACSVVDPVAKKDAITLFYSGGEDKIVNSIAASGNPNVSLIRRTDAYKLLSIKRTYPKYVSFYALINDALRNQFPSSPPDQIDKMTREKMFGVSPQNTDISKIGEGYWTKVSTRFARESHGNALVLCPDADEDRIFSRDELKNWLDVADDNDTINGIPKYELVKLSGPERFEKVKEAARKLLSGTKLSFIVETNSRKYYITKTGRDFKGSDFEEAISQSSIIPGNSQKESNKYSYISDVFKELKEKGHEIDPSKENFESINDIIEKVGGKKENAIKVIQAANYDLSSALKSLSKPVVNAPKDNNTVLSDKTPGINQLKKVNTSKTYKQIVTKADLKKLDKAGIKHSTPITINGITAVLIDKSLKGKVTQILSNGPTQTMKR